MNCIARMKKAVSLEPLQKDCDKENDLYWVENSVEQGSGEIPSVSQRRSCHTEGRQPVSSDPTQEYHAREQTHDNVDDVVPHVRHFVTVGRKLIFTTMLHCQLSKNLLKCLCR